MKQGWEIKKLGEVCEIVGGSTPKTKEPTYWNGEYYWATPADLNGSKYISSTMRTITDAGIKSAHLQLLPTGTVLLSSRAPIGKVAITAAPMYCNQGFKNLICGNTLNNGYAYWFLSHNTHYLNSLGAGATFKEISKKVVEQIPITIHPLSEQERIVAELDLLSDVIAKKREQLKQLDTLAQSIFYDMFGDPITNEKGWRKEKITKIAPIEPYQGDISGINGMYWLLNLDMIQSNKCTIHEKVYVQYDEVGTSTIKFNKDNVLYSKLRPYLNKVVIPNDSGYCTSELVPFKPFENIILKIFLCYVLSHKSFVNYISSKVIGAKMPRVSMDALREFNVITPPLPLQQQFASKIEAIEKQKELIKQSLSEVQQLFDSRMDYYFG